MAKNTLVKLGDRRKGEVEIVEGLAPGDIVVTAGVLKVRDGDTVIIPPGLDHAQVSAPGYGMYYLWMIRHLPGNPYTGFTFAEEHRWTLDPAQQGWRPKNPPPGLT